MFTDRQLRATLVAEEYSFGGRCADVIGLWLEYDEVRGIYKVSRRVGEKTVHHTAEVRIVEVKVSRDDFLGGIRKGQVSNGGNGFGAFADYCYLAVPRPWSSVLSLDELPSGWGLLVCAEGIDYRHQPYLSIELHQKATRLAPPHALTADVERLARGLGQSALWRLYGQGKKAPDELDGVEIAKRPPSGQEEAGVAPQVVEASPKDSR